VRGGSRGPGVEAMRARLGGASLVLMLLAWLAPGLAEQTAEAARIELDVVPHEATVGQPLEATLSVTLPPDVTLEPLPLGPQWGPFTVLGGDWDGPREEGQNQVWVWRGKLAAYRTGELELPAIALRVQGTEGAQAPTTAPLSVTIHSVLAAAEREQGAGDPADLKPPASVPPDFRPLWTALGLLGLLLAAAAVLVWLQRRYARRLARARVPSDPFHRTPPHVWAFGELQRLLERRLPEQGEVEHFYRELAWILKRYLGGRFRVELMELTTAEVPGSLEQSGAPRQAIVDAVHVLRECDRVKFARERPEPAHWKSSVEQVYGIVDRTKPAESADTESGERGAA